MNKKSINSIILALVVTFIIQLILWDNNATNSSSQVGLFIGGFIGIFIIIISFPLVISLIIFLFGKNFPNEIFSILIYISILIVSYLYYNSMKFDYEILRFNLKSNCIETTKAVYSLIDDPNERNDMIEKNREYCECLYDKITINDLKRIYNEEIEIPELLNIEYKNQKDNCNNEIFGNAIDNTASSFEKFDEKQSFWLGKLLSYHLFGIPNFNAKDFKRVQDCFEPFFVENYSKFITEWEKKNYTSTEVFRDFPELKDKINNCYKDKN